MLNKSLDNVKHESSCTRENKYKNEFQSLNYLLIINNLYFCNDNIIFMTRTEK